MEIGVGCLIFLSTLSLRRATNVACGDRHKLRDFYPRSPCGERLPPDLQIWGPLNISIHALLAESDSIRSFLLVLVLDFYPRSPCGERPPHIRNTSHGRRGISIHALLAESDLWGLMGGSNYDDFYPRSPCGERLVASVLAVGGSR